MAKIVLDRHHEGVRQRRHRSQRRLAGDRRRRVHGAGRARPAAASPRSCACSPGSRRSPPARSRSTTRRSPTCRPKDRDIAMVFQNYALYPHMTVEQNLAFGLKLRRTPKDERARAGSGGRRRSSGSSPCSTASPPQLSGGQRQRVAMGRAMVREPRRVPDGRAAVEPGRQAARADARRARCACTSACGTTTVYVTHDQVEAMTLGRPGGGPARRRSSSRSTRRSGSTPDPTNLFVAAFIGSPPMNLVEAEVEGDAISVRRLPRSARRAHGPVGPRRADA